MAAQAKTRRKRGANTAATSSTAVLETKGGLDLETKDTAVEEKAAETKAEPKAKADLDRLESIINEVKSLEAANADVAGDRHVQTKGKREDPLTEQKQDRVVDALERATELLREFKSREADMERKSQRPPEDGREGLNFDDVDGGETKGDDFDLEYKGAFLDYVRTGEASHIHDFFEQKDMSTLRDEDGGFFVPEYIADRVVEIAEETGEGLPRRPSQRPRQSPRQAP